MSRLPNPRRWSRLAAVALAAAAGCALPQYRYPNGENGVPVVIAGPVAQAKPADPPAVVPAAFQTPAKEQPKPLPAAGKGDATLPASPVKAGGLTLDQAINATLLADPRLRAGFEAINQANADALTASLKPNPELFTDAQLLPLTRPFTVDRQGGPPQQDVNVSYPIDWFLFGKRAAAMQATALGVRASESEYADRVRLRVLEAASAYYDVVEAKALLGLARQDVDNLKRVEAATARSAEAGGRTQVDTRRSRLDRLRGEQVLRDADNTLIGATARLRALLGRGDADPAFEVADLADEPAVEPPPVEEAFAVAQANRPDIQALRWRAVQAQSNIELERRRGYPAVTPQAGYTRQYQTRAVGFPDANSYSLALTMTLPFNDRNQGNVARATSLATQSQFELQAGVVGLRAEVVQADQQLRTAAASVKAAAGEQLRLAEQVRDAITLAYEAGGRSLLETLDAQRTYRDTYRLLISSRAGYGRAVVRYYGTLGKLVSP